MPGDRFGIAADRAPALVADVARLLTNADERLGISTATLRARLNANLTVAVAGRTNAGKSTLVNALIGHRIAPTRATECTQVVTWFRFDPQETARVVHTDGSTRTLQLTEGGRLPDDPGSPLEAIEKIEVTRSYAPLRGLTIIDTPGLFGDEGLGAQTEQLLSADTVDVLIFVYSDPITDYEMKLLRDFRARAPRVYDAPVNVLGVLSHADKLGGQAEAWENAVTVAGRDALAMSDQLCGVVPVIGRIAETTETGRFNQTHADSLRRLAALPPELRATGLHDADLFAELTCDVPALSRVELVERLDMYGIRAMVGSDAAQLSVPRMSDALRALLGVAELRDRIETMFVRPAVVHRAARALTSLRRSAARSKLSAADRDWLDDAIGAIRADAAMHVLEELRALAILHCGRCDLAVKERQSAIRLFSRTDPADRLGVAPTDPAALSTTAEQAHDRWREIANSAMDPQARRVAETAAWSAALIVETRSHT